MCKGQLATALVLGAETNKSEHQAVRLMQPNWIVTASMFVIGGAAGHVGAKFLGQSPSAIAVSNIHAEMAHTTERMEHIEREIEEKFKKVYDSLNSLENERNACFDKLERAPSK